jgi:phosphatidylinositol alpha-mannosyltransferase
VKVALACPYDWDAPGGVQVHVRQLAASLTGRGHDTLILAPGRRPSNDPGVRIVGKPVRVPFNGSVAPICPDPRSRSRIGRALADFRPDVVHAHEPFTPSTSMFAVLTGAAPVVATFHAYAERSVGLALFSPLLRRVWDRVAVRLAVSDAAASFAGRHFEGPIQVVPNGVDVELFAGAVPAELPAGRRLLFVNRLEARKGFAVALRAFDLLLRQDPNLLLVVAGDGPERGELEQLRPEARARVIMLGNVGHWDLPPYHAAADVFLGPATGGESFGIVLVEAMAAGLPVVASDIPGYREVVRGDIDGLLVPPGDPVALAAAVRRVLAEPALADRLRAAARARADRYRWETVAAEVEAAYGRALGR